VGESVIEAHLDQVDRSAYLGRRRPMLGHVPVDDFAERLSRPSAF